MTKSSNQLPDFSIIKHMSHVFLDGEIGGTPLDEGSTLDATIPFFKRFMISLKKNQQSSEMQVIADLAKHGFQDDTFRNLDVLISQFEQMIEFDKRSEDKMLPQDILNAYEKNGDVFFPGGWAGKKGKSGHAMTYRLHKDPKTGETIFTVYNTGAGIQYHGSMPLASGKEGYYPTYAFKFKYDAKDKDTMLAVLEKFTAPRRRQSNEDYNAEKLYEKIFEPACVWLNAKNIPGKELSPPILGQRDGTCVWHSCMQAMQPNFKNKESFRQFILAFRLYLLELAVDERQIANVEKSMPGYRKLLKQCLSNTTRMLDTDLKAGVKEWGLQNDIKKRIVARLENWKQTLSQPSTRVNQSMKPYVDHKNLSNGRAQDNFVNTDDLIFAVKLPKQDKNVFNPENKTFMDALKELNNLGVNEENENELIERFCFAFSDSSKPLFNGKQAATPEEILTQLEKLKNKYLQNQKIVTPRSTVVSLSFISLMDRICEEGMIAQDKKQLSCVEFFVSDMLPFVQQVCANPFLATEDAHLDLMRERILTFYQNKYKQYNAENMQEREAKRFRYYMDIIREAPAAEKEVIRREFKKDIATPGLEKALKREFASKKINAEEIYYYSYLKADPDTGQRVKLNTPYLNRLFAFEERVEQYQCDLLRKMSVRCQKSYQGAEVRAEMHKNQAWYSEEVILRYRPSYDGEGFLAPVFILLTDNFDDILLDPKMLQLHYAITSPSIKNALTSHYDNNPFNSQELSFNRERSAFSPETFISGEKRCVKEKEKRSFEVLSDVERLENKLQRLRASSECMVLLLLNELAEQPEWLSNPEMQQYVELSIFQPGALLKTLQTPSDLWMTLENIFKKCHFNNDPACPEPSEWFLLRLAAKISAYALELNDVKPCLDEKSKTACLEWQQKLLQAVTLRLQTPDLTTEELLEYNTLKLEALLQLGVRVESDVSDLADTYLMLMLLPESNKVGHILQSQKRQHLLERACDVLSVQPEVNNAISENIIKLLQNRANNIGALVYDNEASRFPELVFNDVRGEKLTVFMRSRNILYNHHLIAYLPLSITTSVEYRHLFGLKPQLAGQNRTANGKRFKFTKDGQVYRIDQTEQRGLSVLSFQKKVNDKWYTLAAPTQDIAAERGVPFAVFTNANPSPPLFEQADYWCWVHDRNDYFIEKGKDHRKVYEKLNKNADGLVKIEANGSLQVRREINDKSILNRLEHNKYMELLGDNTIYLPRYGLSFVRDGLVTYTADNRYRLEEPLDDQFGSGVILRAMNHEDKDKYLMPLQPYFRLPDEGKNKIEFGMYHDLANYIAEKAVQDRCEQDGNYKRRGWDFHDSERCVEFFYGKDNVCHAQTATDKIYLAYLYLVQNQASKALECLASCEYQGTPEEMQRLHWLLNKLPVITDNKIQPIVNSKSLAIQMQVISVMVSLKKHYPACCQVPQVEDNHSDTAWFKREQQSALQNYIDQLHRHASALYEVYDNRRNNIPVAMRLSVENEKNILSFIQSEQEVESPNIEDEQRRHLGVVGTRYLEKFGEAGNKVQLTSIYHSQERQMQNVTSPIGKEEVSFNIITAKIRINIESDMGAYYAKKVLSPWMEMQALMDYFTVYYQMAREQNSPDKDKIRHFCQAFLTRLGIKADMTDDEIKAFRDEERIAIVLVSSLWGILHEPAQFPEKYSQLANHTDENTKRMIAFKALSAKYKDLLAKYPIPLVSQASVERLHQVKPTPAVMLPHVAPKLVGATDSIDPLTGIEPLLALRKKLQKLEKENDKSAEDLMKEMSGLKEQPLATQNEVLESIDTRLLLGRKELDEKQLHEYKKYKEENPSDISSQLAINEKRILDKKEEVTQRIEQILGRRERPAIAEVGKQSKVPTVKGLVKSYSQLREEDYLKLGILREDIANLQSNIENLLAIENGEQRLLRLKQALHKDQAKSTRSTQHAVIAALLSENKVTSKQAAVFQYISKIGLYPKQARVLEILVDKSPAEAVSYLVKLIMGGGKTKVILPLLVSLLADGTRLPVVLVPDSSLNTNFSDLRATSMNSLQQNAFLFQFNRDTPCEPARLRHMYESFQTALKHKQYFVTAPSCMQSLDLKYFEILYNKNHAMTPLSPETIASMDEQLHWLGLTRKLLKTQSTVVIDESHLLLHIRKELNYALGKKNLIDVNTSDMVASLFAWLDKVPAVLSTGVTLSFRQLLKDPNHLTDEKMAAELMRYYVKEMCYGKLRSDYVDGLLIGSLTVDDLYKYLLDEVTTEEEKRINAILSAYPPIMAKWLLLREEFSHLFKLTIRSKLHENYGPDIKDSSNPFAIPYRAVNSPTPYIFANFLEAYNYTAQMLYCDGVMHDHFMNLLRAWQNQAQLERQSDPEVISATERKFNYIFDKEKPPLSLLRLNLSDPILMEDIYNKYKNSTILVQQILRETLSSLTLDHAILRSDTLNLVAMFDKAIAFSATPENHRTYHPKIDMVYETSFLIESQVMDFLREKKTPITTFVSEGADENAASAEFIQQITKDCAPMSVLLDCGGRLRGLYNLDVVKELEKAYVDNEKMKYILFYQGSDLYAWKVRGEANQQPLKLTSTDPEAITAELGGCLPDERFTFLDQEHTVGVDIKQAPDARAVVTVDIKTTISSFLQAVMRMRDFANDQQVVIAIDPKVKELMQKSDGDDSLEQLFTFLKNNQTTQLEIDHFSAAIKKIRNFFREDLDNRLLNEADPVKRDQAYRVFEHFFIDMQTDDIIALYKIKAKLSKTKEILDGCADDFLDDWRKCLKKAEVSEAEIATCEKKMAAPLKDICETAVRVCADQNVYPPFQGNREMQQQKQQLKQAQKKMELKKLDELKNPMLTVRKIELDWIKLLVEMRISPDRLACTRLNFVIRQPFSNQIFATDNLLYAHNDQEKTDVYNAYTKMPTAILFEKTPEGLNAVLLCAEEADELKKRLANNERGMQDKIWLSTLSGANFTPMPVLDQKQIKMRLALLEQASFFAGRADILFSLPSVEWLSDHVNEKLEFLEKTVKPALGIHEDQLQRLAARFDKLERYINTWAKYPIDSPVVSNAIAGASLPTQKRLKVVLPYLLKLRQTNAFISIEKLIEDIGFQDALLVDAYQNARIFLQLLKDKQFDTGAKFFMQNVLKFPEGILCYGVPHHPLVINADDIKQILDRLPDADSKMAWTRQIFMLPDFVRTLSQDKFVAFIPYLRAQDFCNYVSTAAITNADRITYVQYFLTRPTVTDEGIQAIAKVIKEFDEDFAEEALKGEKTLATLILLQRADIHDDKLMARVRQAEFCQAVDYLYDHKLLNASYLQDDSIKILLLLQNLGIKDGEHIKKVLDCQVIHGALSKWHAKHPLQKSDIEKLTSLLDKLQSFHLLTKDNANKLTDENTRRALFAILDSKKMTGADFVEAFNDPVLFLAKKVESDLSLNFDGLLFDEFNPARGLQLRECVAKRYLSSKPHLDKNTCLAIDVLTKLRKKLRQDYLSESILMEVDEFIKAILVGFLPVGKGMDGLLFDIFHSARIFRDQNISKSIVEQTISLLREAAVLSPEPVPPKPIQPTVPVVPKPNVVPPLPYIPKVYMPPPYIYVPKPNIVPTVPNIPKPNIVPPINIVLPKPYIVPSINIVPPKPYIMPPFTYVPKPDDVPHIPKKPKVISNVPPKPQPIQPSPANPPVVKQPQYSRDTLDGIQALKKVRDELQKNKAYAKHLNALNQFTRDAIDVLIQHDGIARTPNAESQIMNSMDKLAHHHFKQRHLVAKICADVLLALTVVGFLVFAARRLSGRSFMLHQSVTDRQKKFEGALITSQGWNPNKYRRH